MNDASNQLGPERLGHRFIPRMKRRLIQMISVFKRRQRRRRRAGRANRRWCDHCITQTSRMDEIRHPNDEIRNKSKQRRRKTLKEKADNFSSIGFAHRRIPFCTFLLLLFEFVSDFVLRILDFRVQFRRGHGITVRHPLPIPPPPSAYIPRRSAAARAGEPGRSG